MRGHGFSFSPSLYLLGSLGVWDTDLDRPRVKKQEEVEVEGGDVGLLREKNTKGCTD